MMLISRCRSVYNIEMDLKGVWFVGVHWCWVTVTGKRSGCCVDCDWTADSWNRGMCWLTDKLIDIRHPSRSKWELSSSEQLRCEDWQLITDDRDILVSFSKVKNVLLWRSDKEFVRKLRWWPATTCSVLTQRIAVHTRVFVSSQVGIGSMQLVWLFGWLFGWLVGLWGVWL